MGQIAELVLSVLVLTSQLPEGSEAAYESSLCDKYVSGGVSTDMSPYFYLDYTTLLAKTVFLEDQNKNLFEEEKRSFSAMNKQALVTRTTSTLDYLFSVDVTSNECFYQADPLKPCMKATKTCSAAAKQAEWITVNGGAVQLGTASQSMLWPDDNLKAKVFVKKMPMRGVQTDKYVTCTYDSANDATTVSEWYLVDTKKYPKMDSSKNFIVTATHRKRVAGKKVLSVRMDYSNYQHMRKDELVNGVYIPENKCKSIQIGEVENKMPPPPARFSYSVALDITTDFGESASSRLFQYHEYNHYAQMYRIQEYTPADTTDEVNEKYTYYDETTGLKYVLDYTIGTCKVDSSFDEKIKTKMASPKAFWGMDKAAEQTYVGRYSVRDIPVDLWYILHPVADGDTSGAKTIGLYLATEDWLKQQQLDPKMFYPVQVTTKNDKEKDFQSIFEYKVIPGYHIPDLSWCYMEKDIVHAKVTIRRDFFTDVNPSGSTFLYDFRQAIRKITGFVSAVRIVNVVPRQNPENDKLTDVYFTMLGRYIGFTGAKPSPDPVLSSEAMRRINEQVDVGKIKYKASGKSATLYFKKGSASVLSKGTYFHVDRAGLQANTFSGGAMAGIAVGLLVVGVLLGVAAIFGVKWWRDRGTSVPNFGMKTLSEDADA